MTHHKKFVPVIVDGSSNVFVMFILTCTYVLQHHGTRFSCLAHKLFLHFMCTIPFFDVINGADAKNPKTANQVCFVNCHNYAIWEIFEVNVGNIE